MQKQNDKPNPKFLISFYLIFDCVENIVNLKSSCIVEIRKKSDFKEIGKKKEKTEKTKLIH